MERILIIDDFITSRLAVKIRIKSKFKDMFIIDMAGSMAEARALMSTHNYFHVVSDLRMPNIEIDEVINEIEMRYNEKHRTFMSSLDKPDLKGFVKKDGYYLDTVLNRVNECISV